LSAVREAPNGAPAARHGHLVVRAPNWVGDLVMATPVLAAAPDCGLFERVTVLVRGHLAGVLRSAPWESELALHAIERGSNERALLEGLRPDAILLLSNSLGAAWRAFRARVPVRAGANLSGRRLLLTHSVTPPTRAGRRVPIPSAHLMRDVAGLVGILPADLHPRLGVSDAARASEHTRLARLGVGQDYVLCCPGAAFGAAKLWPPDSFAAVLDQLHEHFGWRAIVTGGPGEEPLMHAVTAACRHAAVSLEGEERDLEKLKALVAGARLLLVGDSGPRWFAAAFDVPCVTLMGPNFPELTATSLEHCEVVRRTDLDCSPCLARTCPLEHHACMTGIEPRRVFEACERVLARAAAPR